MLEVAKLICGDCKLKVKRIMNSATTTRKERSDKVDMAFVLRYSHEYCRLNTFSKKVKVGVCTITNIPIRHKVHNYPFRLRAFYKQFTESPEYIDHLRKNPKQTIKRSLFYRDGICKCMQYSKMEVCSDENETTFIEALEAANQSLRAVRMETDPQKICCCGYCVELKRRCEVDPMCEHELKSVDSFLNSILCPKVAVNVLGIHKSIYQYKCCLETCTNCEQRKLQPDCVLNCPRIWSAERTATWYQYEDVEMENHKLGKIRQIAKKHGTAADLKVHLLKSFARYVPHRYDYNWLEFNRECQREHLQPNEVYITTDYSAMVKLLGNNSLNSTGSGVCVLGCWVIMSNPRMERITEKDGSISDRLQNDCEHVRVVSPATGYGKCQDWFLHCRTLEKMIEIEYEKNQNLSRILLHSDGSPAQYKNRYNFAWIARLRRKYPGMEFVHTFGATAQFKGPHDGVGFKAKQTVRLLEMDKSVRCPTAYEFYAALLNGTAQPPSGPHKMGRLRL